MLRGALAAAHHGSSCSLFERTNGNLGRASGTRMASRPAAMALGTLPCPEERREIALGGRADDPFHDMHAVRSVRKHHDR